MFLKNLYIKLSIQEKNGRKIGLFRTLCAVFGGLFVAYLGMTLFVFMIPTQASKSITIPLMLNTLVWSVVALWIAVSSTKWIALMRSIIPSIIFLITIALFFYGGK